MNKTDQDLLLSTLSQLVHIPSYVDLQHQEKELTDFICQQLATNPKLTVERINSETNRDNIIAYEQNTNSQIVLFGHQDTVLPKKDNPDCFTPIVKDDKLFGLGAVDMKAGLAVMLHLATHHHTPGVAYVFSVDEEYEFKGTLKLADYDKLHPKTIINLEPTDNKILCGCRGITEFSFQVHGTSAHAGRKYLGTNAIEKTIELTQNLQQIITKLDSPDGPQSSLNLAYLHGGVLQEIGIDKEPIISGLGMVVPNFAQVNCEIRIGNPKITQQFIEENILQIGINLGITISDIKFKFYLGSLQTNKENLKDFESVVKEVTGSVEYANINQSGFYELQIIQNKWGGVPIIYGPGPNSTSHTLNEFVDIPSIYTTYDTIDRFISKFLG